MRVSARAHSSFGQFGRTYRFLFGQVPQMLGKCPMSDCNFILCEGTPGNPPEDTGATDGVDIVDQTSPVEGIITCACSSDATAALS